MDWMADPHLKAVAISLAVLGGIVVLLLLANAMAAVLNRIHIHTNGPVPHETAQVVWGLLPYKLRVSRLEFHGKQLNIDKDGWRTGKSSGGLFDEWSPADYNVLMLGGSPLFGYTVDDDQTLSAHLQEIVNAKAKRKVRIYNLGQMGTNSRDEVYLLVDQIREERIPNLVIFYDGANEFGRGVRGTNFHNVRAEYIDADYSYYIVADAYAQGHRILNPQYLASWKFAERLRGIGKRFLKNSHPMLTDEELSPLLEAHARSAAQWHLRNLKVAAHLAAVYHFDVKFILHPMGICLDDYASYPFPYFGPPRNWQVIYYRQLVVHVTKQAQNDLHASIVNLSSCLNEPIANGSRPFNTMFHLNPEGNQYMASVLFDLIEDLIK